MFDARNFPAGTVGYHSTIKELGVMLSDGSASFEDGTRLTPAEVAAAWADQSLCLYPKSGRKSPAGSDWTVPENATVIEYVDPLIFDRDYVRSVSFTLPEGNAHDEAIQYLASRFPELGSRVVETADNSTATFDMYVLAD